MKKILLLTLSALLLTFVPSCKNDKGEEQQPHFITDANFLKFCLERYDLNSDGKFTREEAAQITELILNNENIYSLEGIEYFTGLVYLDCTENFISHIDMSASPGLRVLNANCNPLKTVDVTKNPLLEELGCTPRDIGTDPIGKHPGQLEKIDVTNNPLLKSLDLNCLGLTEINISGNSRLEKLYLDGNKIPRLDISHCTGLVELYASSAGIEELILPPPGTLKRLNIEYNAISSLDLGGQSSLIVLGCSGNPLQSIGNLKECTMLYNFSCSDCLLTRLDVSGLGSLRMLYCYDNALTSLDITGCGSLWILNCDDNKLPTITTDGLMKLETFYCRRNALTSLDLRSNTAMRYLYTSGNPGLRIEISSDTYDQLANREINNPTATFNIES